MHISVRLLSAITKINVNVRNTHDINAHIYNINLKTCAPLYSGAQRLKDWHLRFGPKDGLDVSVDYLDTKPGSTSAAVLALHGAPGSLHDYNLLFHFVGHDHRLIVPTFPNFYLTDRTNLFWHSAEEKAQLVRDLLKALNITTIDCLIAHSSSIFPASHLWMRDDELNNDLTIKSIVMLNTPGPDWLTKKQRRRIAPFVHIARIPPVRRYLRSMWSMKWTQRVGAISALSDYFDLALLYTTAFMSRYQTQSDRLKKLAEYMIPTLFVFSSKDKLMNIDIFYATLHELRAKYENFDIYEEHSNMLVQKGDDNDWLKVVHLSGGGHYSFITFAPLVHRYIERLLNKIKQ